MAYLSASEWRVVDTTSPYLTRDLEPEITSARDFFQACPTEPFTTIPDVLNAEGLKLLGELTIPPNGKCDTELVLANPASKALVSIMGRISLSNCEYDLSADRVVASLHNESGRDVSVMPHRDLLDGHAVLFNWGVEGDLSYVIGGVEVPVANNKLVVLNGAANWQEVTAALYADLPVDLWRFGGTTAIHGVVGSGFTSRNRLLVYADGQETQFTQIFEDQYGPDPRVADNVLYAGLRPSFGVWLE